MGNGREGGKVEWKLASWKIPVTESPESEGNGSKLGIQQSPYFLWAFLSSSLVPLVPSWWSQWFCPAVLGTFKGTSEQFSASKDPYISLILRPEISLEMTIPILPSLKWKYLVELKHITRKAKKINHLDMSTENLHMGSSVFFNNTHSSVIAWWLSECKYFIFYCGKIYIQESVHIRSA